MQLSRWPLSLRPRCGEQVPSLTAQIARASNPGSTTAMRVRDRLDGLWCDEDFAEQQTPGWKARYTVQSGVEGTINEFAHGHGMRHCRYRGQLKAHLQHVFTAIAVNIERLSGLKPAEEPSSPRPPTAFRIFLDQNEIPRSKSWRIPRHLSPAIQDPRRSQVRCAGAAVRDRCCRRRGGLPFR
ncbi:transposase [Streptomyces sp. NPDC058122]|uniref:transposase n=1 Tax=Streptomyces sp. NPDC058122 TaxID=3346349 RepID=UPI0036EDF6AD